MDRRQFLASGAAAAVASQLGACRPEARPPGSPRSPTAAFEIEEDRDRRPAGGDRRGPGSRRRAITQQYLDRIAAHGSFRAVGQLGHRAQPRGAGRSRAARRRTQGRQVARPAPRRARSSSRTTSTPATGCGRAPARWRSPTCPRPLMPSWWSGFALPARSSWARPIAANGPTSARRIPPAAGAAAAGRRAIPTCSTAIRAARVRAPGPPSAPTLRRSVSAPRRTARWSARALPTASSGSSPPSAS